MSKACNPKDLIVSFLYLESLRKRGVLDNASPKLLNTMSEKSFERLAELSKERERMIASRKKLGGYPVVNLISKDYAFLLDYEEEYTKPIALGDGRVSSRYALEYDKHTETFAKTENMDQDIIRSVINDRQMLDYENRENVIVTTLTPKAVLRRFHHEAVWGKYAELIIETVLADEEIGNELVELDISPEEAREKITNALRGIPLATVAEDEEGLYAFPNQEALMPIRYDEKAIKGIEIDKSTLSSHYMNYFAKLVDKGLAELGIQNGEERIRAILESEENDGIFLNVADDVQKILDKEAVSFIETVIFAGLRDGKKALQRNSVQYNGEVLELFMDLARSAPIEVDIEITPDNEEVALFATSKKDEVTHTSIAPYILAPSDDDPANFKRHNIRAHKATLYHKLGTETSNVIIKNIYETDVEVPLNANFNTSKAKSYRVAKTFASDFDRATLGEEAGKRQRRTAIVDEADQNAGGGQGAVLTYLFRENASKIVVATGTPINGMPESTVNILQFGGVMRGEDVEKSKAEFETLYGVYSINSSFLALLVQGLNNKKISDETKTIYSNIMSAEKDRKRTSNTNELYEKAVKSLLNLLVEEGLMEQEAAMNMDIFKETGQLSILFGAVAKLEAKHKSMDFRTLFGMALTNTHTLTTKEPKVSSLKGYASTVVSTIGSQAVSSTDAGQRKNIVFENYNDFKLNFHPEKPAMNFGMFKENNRIGIRIAQALVSAYKNEKFIDDIFLYLTKTYDGFYRMLTTKGAKGKKIRESVLETIKENNPDLSGVTESDLYTLAEKSAPSKSDSFASLYRNYLNYNGDIGKLYKKNNEHINKRVDLFKETLFVFDSIMKAVPLYQEKIERVKSDNDGKANPKAIPFKVEDGRSRIHDLTGMTYKYASTVQRGERSFDMEGLVASLDGYGYPSTTVFSFVVDLCPKDFNDLLYPDKNGMRMPYRLEIKNRADNEVLDAISSVGAKEKMKEQLKRGANIVNLSQRVITNVANTLNVIAAYKEVLEEYESGAMKEEERKNFEAFVKDNVHIVVNAAKSADEHKMNIKDIFERIKPIEGLEVSLSSRSTMEAILKKSVSYDEKLTCLCTNYRSVSRGFALHYFHKKVRDDQGNSRIITSTLNFIDPRGGGDGIQVLSRLESPMTTENIISLYNGGTDAKQFIYGENVSVLMENMLPVASTPSLAKEKEAELTSVFSGLMSLNQEEAAETFSRINSLIDLPKNLGRTQISVNAERAQTGYETYEQVMRGEHRELTEKQAQKLYGAPVMRLSEIPEEDEEETIAQERNDSQDNAKKIMKEIEEDLGVDMTKIVERHEDTAFEMLMPQ